MGTLAGTETIVALSSGRPPAGIAVIRMSGPGALAAAARVAGMLPEPRMAALRTFREPVNGEAIDRGLVIAFPAPGSVTGEDLVEFHGHGGKAVVDRLLAVLAGLPGVRLAEPGEFTRRALANGRIDLTEADGLADLLAAETELQRRVALTRAEGAVRARLEAWRAALVDLSAAAEVAIDYPDEEDGVVAPALGSRIGALAAEMRGVLDGPRVEPLRDGFRVVLAGPPNAGKSSLINALTGIDRAIVTAEAGTTRDTIEVPLSLDGLPLVLVDTAGLREGESEVERLGVERSRRELERADLVLWLGEGEPEAGALVLAAKSDLPGGADRPGLRVSAETGEGLDELRLAIRERLASRVPSARQLSLNEREAGLLVEVAGAIERAIGLEPLLQAEEFRGARSALDRITGQAGVEEVLDALFARFCLGK